MFTAWSTEASNVYIIATAALDVGVYHLSVRQVIHIDASNCFVNYD